jgi:hypothetical protein
MVRKVKSKQAGVKIENFEEINEEKVLFQWMAPERAFQKRDRDYWITVVAILALVAMILFLIKEFFLIMALLSVLFLYYVLSTTPPEIVENKITNRGVYFGSKRYDWGMLERFWIGKSLKMEMIYFETALKFPRQISLVINPGDGEAIKKIVAKRLPLLDYSPTFVDKMTKWVGERLPLENRE